jgi:hypothetical protein
MSNEIPLPEIPRNPKNPAHPYPLQIAVQTQEFLEGTLFYAITADLAAGGYVRQPGALDALRKEMTSRGLTIEQWESAWGIINKYSAIFERWVFQNFLIFMRSHWDWYVRKLGEFVEFARGHVECPALGDEDKRDLGRVGFKEVTSQIEILERACGLTFGLRDNVILDLYEMALLRNLGMHSRWEVDAFYKSRTHSGTWEVGQVRIIDQKEMLTWHESLIEAIRRTSQTMSIRFAKAPDYPPKPE